MKVHIFWHRQKRAEEIKHQKNINLKHRKRVFRSSLFKYFPDFFIVFLILIFPFLFFFGFLISPFLFSWFSVVFQGSLEKMVSCWPSKLISRRCSETFTHIQNPKLTKKGHDVPKKNTQKNGHDVPKKTRKTQKKELKLLMKLFKNYFFLTNLKLSRLIIHNN